MTIWINERLGVISLFESMTEEGVIIIDVRDLSDVEKDVSKVQKKIMIATNLLCAGERVAIRCIAGMNRSCGIAVGILCYMNVITKLTGKINMNWNYQYDILKEKCPRVIITSQFERTVKEALKKLDGRYNGTD